MKEDLIKELRLKEKTSSTVKVSFPLHPSALA